MRKDRDSENAIPLPYQPGVKISLHSFRTEHVPQEVKYWPRSPKRLHGQYDRNITSRETLVAVTELDSEWKFRENEKRNIEKMNEKTVHKRRTETGRNPEVRCFRILVCFSPGSETDYSIFQ